MKLVVKISDTPGGRALLLHDEQGEPLPCQAGIVLRHDVEDIARLTVTFIIDGDEVSLG